MMENAFHSEEDSDTISRDKSEMDEKSSTKIEAEHKVLAFGLLVISADKKVLVERLYQAAEKDSEVGTHKANYTFINALLSLEKQINKYKKTDDKKPPTSVELDMFFNDTR